MLNEDLVAVLNKLIRISEDRKLGFSQASRESDEQSLFDLFQRRSTNCAAAVTELQFHVRSLGGIPKAGGTFAGIIRRRWMQLKAAIGGNDDALFEELKRNESLARTAYSSALAKALPQQICRAIRLQHYAAIRNYNLICDLRSCHQATRATFST